MDTTSINKRKRPVCDTDCDPSPTLTAEKRQCTPQECSLLSEDYGLVQYSGPPYENKYWEGLYWPQAQFDDGFMTPATPTKYVEFSSDESVCTRESVPTTPEGGFTPGTAPEDGFTPLDSPPLYSIFSAPYTYDMSAFEVPITSVDSIEVTAPPRDPPTEQANNNPPTEQASSPPLICPSLESQGGSSSPFGEAYGLGQLDDDVQDAIRCLVAEAEADGESLSDLGDMLSPLDLGEPAMRDEKEDDQHHQTEHLDTGLYEGDPAALAQDHKVLETALAGADFDMIEMLEAMFDKDEKTAKRGIAKDDVERGDTKDEIERGYAGDSEK
ncbi:hypothetical protein CC79DRAFT_1366964 [Sarocladium strictum]